MSPLESPDVVRESSEEHCVNNGLLCSPSPSSTLSRTVSVMIAADPQDPMDGVIDASSLGGSMSPFKQPDDIRESSEEDCDNNGLLCSPSPSSRLPCTVSVMIAADPQDPMDAVIDASSLGG